MTRSFRVIPNIIGMSQMHKRRPNKLHELCGRGINIENLAKGISPRARKRLRKFSEAMIYAKLWGLFQIFHKLCQLRCLDHVMNDD